MLEVKHVPTTTNSIDGLSDFTSQVVESLRKPTLDTGEWYNLITPEFMYGGVNPEMFDGGPMQANFGKTYSRKTKGKSELRGTYSRLITVDRKWQAQSMVDDLRVRKAIEKVVQPIPDIITMIQNHPEGESHKSLVKYLEAYYDLLPKGEFDKLMVKFLKYDPAEDVRFHWLPVEYRDDPMGDRATPQGFLAVVDREATDRANDDRIRYRQSAIHHFGREPIDNWVFVTNTAATSGALALPNSPKSGFNLPNSLKMAAEVGHVVNYEMANNMAKLDISTFSPALMAVTGKESSPGDIGRYTRAHEDRHGDHEDGEGNLGRYRTAVREFWAAAGAVVVTDFHLFSSAELQSTVRGELAFASSDCAPFRNRLFNNYGVDQPSLDDLLKVDGYAPGGYSMLRKPILANALGHELGRIDYDTIVRQNHEWEPILRKIAKSGDPDLAYQELSYFFQEEVKERPNYRGYGPTPNSSLVLIDPAYNTAADS